MRNYAIFALAVFLCIVSAFCEPPQREGPAIGYMSTPNSFVYRSPFSSESAMDFWLDLPEVLIGTDGAMRFGGGLGYAMFLMRQDDFAFMVRPQMSFGYVEENYERGEIGIGATAAVTAYLDNLGMDDTDIYAGVSLGSVIEFGEDYTTLRLLLTRESPFGLVIGIMRYF